MSRGRRRQPLKDTGVTITLVINSLTYLGVRDGLLGTLNAKLASNVYVCVNECLICFRGQIHCHQCKSLKASRHQANYIII